MAGAVLLVNLLREVFAGFGAAHIRDHATDLSCAREFLQHIVQGALFDIGYHHFRASSEQLPDQRAADATGTACHNSYSSRKIFHCLDSSH